MRLALYEPDIPQNLGAFIRLAACLATPLDIIEPCGFPVDDKRIRRAAMDYYDLAQLRRHEGEPARDEAYGPSRQVAVGETLQDDLPGDRSGERRALPGGEQCDAEQERRHSRPGQR